MVFYVGFKKHQLSIVNYFVYCAFVAVDASGNVYVTDEDDKKNQV